MDVDALIKLPQLLKRISDQLVDPDAKRHFAEEEIKLENTAKRIRREAHSDVLKDPLFEDEIKERAQQQYDRALKMFWDRVIPDTLEVLSMMDFEVVYEYMKELPAINAAIRNDALSWKRRLILEYPEYWLLNCTEEGGLREESIAQLLADSKKGSGPRSRHPTREDAMYLLYQKARRLSRYINRVSSGEIAAAKQHLDSYWVIPIPVPEYDKVTAVGGAFVLSYVTKIPKVGGPSVAVLHIFDARTKSVSTIENTAPRGYHRAPKVVVGIEYALIHWKDEKLMNIVDLSDPAWLFPEPIHLVENMETTRLKSSLPMDRLSFVDYIVNDDNEAEDLRYEITIKKFKHWLKHNRNFELSGYADWRSVPLLGASVLHPLDSRAYGAILFNPWLPKDYIVNGVFTPQSKIKQANFANSYERPLIYEQKWNKQFTILTDGVTVRRVVKRDSNSLYSVSAAKMSEQYHTDTIIVEDHSNEMRNYGAMLQFTVENDDNVNSKKQRFSVCGNYVCRLLPMEGLVMIYDLWAWYRQNQSTPEEQNYPLLSAPDIPPMSPLCDQCGATATGACSECRTRYYCSTQCQDLDRTSHQCQTK